MFPRCKAVRRDNGETMFPYGIDFDQLERRQNFSDTFFTNSKFVPSEGQRMAADQIVQFRCGGETTDQIGTIGVLNGRENE